MLALTACASTNFGTINPIRRDRIMAVVAETKHQLSVYTAYQRYELPRMIAERRRMNCGYGLISYDVKTVKLELVTSSQGTAGGEAGISANGIGVSVSGSHQVLDAQTLTLEGDIKSSRNRIPYDPTELKSSPIAQVLKDLTEGMISQAGDPSDVCIKTKKGDGSTFKIGITVTDTVGGGVKIGISPAALSATGELKSVTGNTITVTLAPHNFRMDFPHHQLPHGVTDDDLNKHVVAPALL
ncbi:hypothetical protein NKJ06_17275 [Mesorhizobium sp. M0293]|uniref:hypothetical protein n=1 Tax=unclassified Mesorhizobium TaxID=325217 RepID=UPI00333749BD